MTNINITKKEVERYHIVKRYIKGEITGADAAKTIGVTPRQIRNLAAKVRKDGPEGLVHGNRGKKSNNRMPEKERKRIKSIIQDKYPDFKPGHAAEKLGEFHNIQRSSETIRQLMIEANLWKPKKMKTSEYHVRRPPKEKYGELVQLDGSYHRWFEKRAGKCCLLAVVDDATSAIVHAKFVESENLRDIFGFWKEYLETKGKPLEIYTDGLRVYHNNMMEVESKERLTQFKRAMRELGIKVTRAGSSQAKGRIETLFGTLQDRLIKEMRLEGISTRAEGNRYLCETYINRYNDKYAKPPAKTGNLHRETVESEKDLMRILSKQKTRVVQNDFCIQYENHVFQLTKNQPATVRKREKVIVEERLDGTIGLRLRDKYLNHKEITLERMKKLSEKDTPWVLAANTKEKAKTKQG